MSLDRLATLESVIKENHDLIANAATTQDVDDMVTPKLALEISKRLPFENDRLIYRVIVMCLSLVVVSSIFIYAYLAIEKIAIPQSLVALASASMGALAGLLAPSPR